MKAKWLINPFERIAGWQALGIGIVVMALTAIFGKMNGVAFSGVIDVRAGGHSFTAAFAMQAVNLLVLSLMMWFAGFCFSKSKVRIVDVAGTMALSRTPMLLLVIICFIPIVPSSLYDIPRMIVFSILGILAIIWMIALMYQAFTVSCHMKGSKGVISFIGTLILAEIVSVCIFIFLLGSLFINSDTVGNNKPSEITVSANVDIVDLSDIHQTAERIVKAFEQGDFDTIIACFDEKMKKSLPKSGLKLSWMQLNMSYGKFESADMDHMNESVANEHPRLEIPCTFKKGKVYLRLAFNQDGTVCGMFFAPAN